MHKIKKSMAAAGLAMGLLGGGAAGAILGTAGVSGAQTTATVESGAATTDSSAAATGATGAERPDPAARLNETLAPLVTDGTITQAQADAVVAALVAAGPMNGGHGGGHGGPGGAHGGRGGPGLDAAATALGVSADELRTSLQDGQTIAQVAEAEGVDVQTVIDAMVAGLQTHLAEEVASGEHTQAEADQKLADGTARITDTVNNGRPDRPADAPA